MKIHRLRTEIWLPQSREEIFGFFSDPKNLDLLTPPWLSFEILAPECVAMREGTRLDYRLRLHGIPVRWQSEIIAWNPPRRFVDRQTRGPYRLWVHEHLFFEQSGGTLVGDSVEYSALGGRLIQKFLIAPDLEKIFGYRHQMLQERFHPHRLKPAASRPA